MSKKSPESTAESSVGHLTARVRLPSRNEHPRLIESISLQETVPLVVMAATKPGHIFQFFDEYFIKYGHAFVAIQLMLIAGSFNVERYHLAGFRTAALQLCKRFVIAI
jgi:hypothetical protein